MSCLLFVFEGKEQGQAQKRRRFTSFNQSSTEDEKQTKKDLFTEWKKRDSSTLVQCPKKEGVYLVQSGSGSWVKFYNSH